MAIVSFTLPYCLLRISWSQKTKITESLPGAASQPTSLQGILQGGMKSRRSTTQRTRPPLPLHHAGGEFWAVNSEGGSELWPWVQAPISPAHLLLWVCSSNPSHSEISALPKSISFYAAPSVQPLPPSWKKSVNTIASVGTSILETKKCVYTSTLGVHDLQGKFLILSVCVHCGMQAPSIGEVIPYVLWWGCDLIQHKELVFSLR